MASWGGGNDPGITDPLPRTPNAALAGAVLRLDTALEMAYDALAPRRWIRLSYERDTSRLSVEQAEALDGIGRAIEVLRDGI